MVVLALSDSVSEEHNRGWNPLVDVFEGLDEIEHNLGDISHHLLTSLWLDRRSRHKSRKIRINTGNNRSNRLFSSFVVDIGANHHQNLFFWEIYSMLHSPCSESNLGSNLPDQRIEIALLLEVLVVNNSLLTLKTIFSAQLFERFVTMLLHAFLCKIDDNLRLGS